MINCQRSPTFIFCKASVQPGMTRLTGKVAGWLRLIELSKTVPFNKLAFVVDLDHVGGLGRWSVAGLQNPVLQSAGQGHDARLGLGGGQEGLAFAEVLVGLGRVGLRLPGLDLALDHGEGGAKLVLGVLRRCSLDSVVDSLEQRFETDIHPFRLELVADIQSNPVAADNRGAIRVRRGGSPGAVLGKNGGGKQAPQSGRRTDYSHHSSFPTNLDGSVDTRPDTLQASYPIFTAAEGDGNGRRQWEAGTGWK